MPNKSSDSSPKVLKRKAGRPPLAPSDDVQVTIRRERDRLAQRQSRLRKANALSERDQRIDQLSRAIESLTSVFTDFNEVVFQSRVIQSDLDSATRLKHLADRFLSVAQDAVRSNGPDEENEDDDDDDERSEDMDICPPDPSSSSRPQQQHNHAAAATILNVSSRPPPHHHQQPSSPQPLTLPAAPPSAGLPPSERPWSPRLAYGLLAESIIGDPSSSPDPPRPAALPSCVLEPQKTFAWRLLRETYRVSFPLIQRGASALPPHAAPAKLSAIFALTAPHEPLHATAARVALVIEYLFAAWGSPLTARTKVGGRQGAAFRSLEGSALAAREEMATLAMLVKRDVHLRGGDLADYMHPWALERYLAATWGLRLSPANVSLDPAFWGNPAESAPVVADAVALIARLVGTGVCFGNGPRFVRQRVDQEVSAFLSEMGLVKAPGEGVEGLQDGGYAVSSASSSTAAVS